MRNDNSLNEGNGVALKAGIWYVVSTILVRAISIISTPIFTRLLTTEQYGTVSTFTTWYSLLLPVFSLNLIYCIGRAKLDFPGRLNMFIGSMQLLSFLFAAVLSCVLGVLILPISSFFELPPEVTGILILYLVFSPAINFVQSGYRYQYKYKQNIGISFYIALSTVILSLILINVMELDSADVARILGIAMPSIALSGFFWVKILRNKEAKVNIEYWKYGLNISLPLILHTISLYILAQSDRILIAKMCGKTATGIYSLIYNYGALLSMVVASVSEGWLPWFHDNYYLENFDDIRKSTEKIVVFGCYVGLACIALAPEAILVLGGDKYLDGIWCVPPIVLGIICQYIYTHYVNIELHVKKTKYISYGTILAAGINIILNAIFIPIYGFVAAAYTTLFSYVVLMFVHFFITQYILKIKLYRNVFMFGAMAVVSIVTVGLTTLYNQHFTRYGVIIIGFVTFIGYFKEYIFTFIKKQFSNKH